MQSRGRLARPHQRLGRRRVAGNMAAAFEVLRPEIGARKPAPHGIDMDRLAAMRGAGERDLGIAQTEPLGGAGLHQRQGLQRLYGRAREDRAVDVAPGTHHAAGGIDHGCGAGVTALDHLAAGRLDQDWI